MMMTLVTDAGLPPQVVSDFASVMLSKDRDKPYFGTLETVTLLPAGSSSRGKALVLLKRGSIKGELFASEARAMALQWLAAAEATESDHLVTEAMDALGAGPDLQESVFAYLRQLRA